MGIILPADEPTPYKVIETTDDQKTNESCFAPSVDVKVSDDQRKKLKRIVINEGGTDIGSYQFHGCRSLVSVKLSSTLKTIGIDAFSFCTSLEKIDIPEGVELIKAERLYMVSLSEKSPAAFDSESNP